MTTVQRFEAASGYVVAHGFSQLLLWSAFYYLLPALSSRIAAQTLWPVLHISTTYTLAFLVWAASAPLVGWLIDKGFGARVMRTGSILGAALLVALSQTSDPWMFSVVVIGLGACMAATLYDPCFALVMRQLGGDGASAVATVTLIAGFATLLTFPLVFALSLTMGWQHIVLVFAGLAAIGAAIIPAQREASPASLTRHSKMPLERGPALIAVAFGIVMMGHAILLFLLPVVLSRTQSNTNAGMLALAILGPAQIAGRLAWKAFGSATSQQNFVLILFACFCVPAPLLLVFGPTHWALYAALIIQGACYGVHTILRPGLAQLYLRRIHLGQGLGTIAMVGVLLMAIGPAIGGFVWTYAGMSGLMLTILSLNVIAFVLGIFLRRTTTKGPDT